jgi:hypothetical protein
MPGDPPAKGTPPPKGGKLTLKNPVTWVIILGVAVVGGAYLLYRRGKSSGTAASSTGTGSAVDPSAALGTLQSEIGNLQSSGGYGGGTSVVPVGSGSGGGGTVTTDGTGPSSGGNSSGASGGYTDTGSTSSSNGSSSGSSSSGSSTPATGPLGNGKQVSKGANRATISWTDPGITQWAVTRFGPGSPNGITNIVSTPQAVYSGLASGHNYYAVIQPLVNGKPSGSTGRVDFSTS